MLIVEESVSYPYPYSCTACTHDPWSTQHRVTLS